jgi:hypothetical protein
MWSSPDKDRNWLKAHVFCFEKNERRFMRSPCHLAAYLFTPYDFG